MVKKKPRMIARKNANKNCLTPLVIFSSCLEKEVSCWRFLSAFFPKISQPRQDPVT
jgi:hypothetical protein